MATSGQRPKPNALKLVTGNPGKRALDPTEVEIRETPLLPPVELEERAQQLWEQFIDSAWWLSEHDAPKAYMWVSLEVEFEKCPAGMNSARIGQLRALGSELGFDPSARARMPSGSQKDTDPADKYFD